jgi:hypothetical protein
MVGGPDVTRDQLQRLIELAGLRNIDLRVLAASAGAYPAMGLPFSILSFADKDPDVGYVELLNKGLYLEELHEVQPYTLAFDDLRRAAFDPTEPESTDRP